MLPKQNRLKLEKDFENIFRDGAIWRTNFVTLRTRANGLKCSRYAIIISSKVDKKAVVRNRLCRQVSEIIRTNLDDIIPGFDVTFSFRKEIIGKSYGEIKDSLGAIFKKAGLLTK